VILLIVLHLLCVLIMLIEISCAHMDHVIKSRGSFLSLYAICIQMQLN
jgi:hypothetical protein